MRRSILLIVLLASSMPVLHLSPACAQEYVGRVTILLEGKELPYCVPITDAGPTAVTLLRATGLPIVTRSFGGDLGEAICMIDGFGDPQRDCPGSNGHWHLWLRSDDEWVSSDLGASNVRVDKSTWQAWTWEISDSPTPPSGLSTECDPPLNAKAPRSGNLWAYMAVAVLASAVAPMALRRIRR